MMHAYDKVYLDCAKKSLGRMCDFAVYDLQYEIGVFYELFLKSGIADCFGKGDYRFITGMSGVEVAFEVLERMQIQTDRIAPHYTNNRSEEYWTGWALAHYQWETALRFEEIEKVVPISDVKLLYTPYHEMDIRHFTEKMNELYRMANPDTNLKRRRRQVGLSQSELADLSGIPLRTIQQYEQRQKNINHAKVDYLFRLSGALGCDVEGLIEKV